MSSTSTFSVVKITNDGHSPITMVSPQNAEKISILPGQTRTVPLELAYMAFGDPNAYATDLNARREYFAMYRNAYCFQTGWHSETDWENGVQDPRTGLMRDLKPRYTAHDEDGNRIYFMLDDPFMEKDLANTSPLVAAPRQTDMTQAGIQRRLDAMEALNRELLAKLSALLPGDSPIPPVELPEVDLPPAPDMTIQIPTDSGSSSQHPVSKGVGTVTDGPQIPGPKPNTTAKADGPRAQNK